MWLLLSGILKSFCVQWIWVTSPRIWICRIKKKLEKQHKQWDRNFPPPFYKKYSLLKERLVELLWLNQIILKIDSVQKMCWAEHKPWILGCTVCSSTVKSSFPMYLEEVGLHGSRSWKLWGKLSYINVLTFNH